MDLAGYINQYGNATQEVKISCPAGRVYSVEIIDELAQRAIQRLKRQGYTNVEVRVGNGHTGWPKHARSTR